MSLCECICRLQKPYIRVGAAVITTYTRCHLRIVIQFSRRICIPGSKRLSSILQSTRSLRMDDERKFVMVLVSLVIHDPVFKLLLASDLKQWQMKQKAASELTLYSSHGDVSCRSYHDFWKRQFRGPLGGYSLTFGLIGPCLMISSLTTITTTAPPLSALFMIILGFSISFLMAVASERAMLGRQPGRRISGPTAQLEVRTVYYF